MMHLLTLMLVVLKMVLVSLCKMHGTEIVITLSLYLQYITAAQADAVAGSSFKLVTFFSFQSVIISGFLTETHITYETNTPNNVEKGNAGPGLRALDF